MIVIPHLRGITIIIKSRNTYSRKLPLGKSEMRLATPFISFVWIKAKKFHLPYII
jgi:hypothetical protein